MYEVELRHNFAHTLVPRLAKWESLPLCGAQVLLLALECQTFNLRITRMVGLSGLEPPTSRLSGVRSNRLSYKPANEFAFRSRGQHGTRNSLCVRSCRSMLPARYACLLAGNIRPLVEMNGIEPMTPCLQSRCSPS